MGQEMGECTGVRCPHETSSKHFLVTVEELRTFALDIAKKTVEEGRVEKKSESMSCLDGGCCCSPEGGCGCLVDDYNAAVAEQHKRSEEWLRSLTDMSV